MFNKSLNKVLTSEILKPNLSMRQEFILVYMYSEKFFLGMEPYILPYLYMVIVDLDVFKRGAIVRIDSHCREQYIELILSCHVLILQGSMGIMS